MGTLLGIAVRERSKGPMHVLKNARVTVERGVDEDFRGQTPGRNVVVLTREGWEAACQELGQSPAWTTRRANLFIEGVPLTDEPGKRLQIGEVVLEVTGECDPCQRMETAVSGLCAALTPDCRAGVCCTVVTAGTIAAGDSVTLT